jgi:hypothetical protein
MKRIKYAGELHAMGKCGARSDRHPPAPPKSFSKGLDGEGHDSEGHNSEGHDGEGHGGEGYAARDEGKAIASEARVVQLGKPTGTPLQHDV